MTSLVAAVLLAGCRARAPVPAPELQILEGEDRRSSAEAVPRTSAIFDGKAVRLRAARGETLGFTVWQRHPQPLRATLGSPLVRLRGFTVDHVRVTRPSTAMYGGGRGAGRYPDGLTPADAPSSDPSYFELEVTRDAAPGRYAGGLQVGERAVPLELTVEDVLLPQVGDAPLVWAYYDPRELAWQHGLPVDADETFALEERCAAMFREHGVLATPELTPAEWPRRHELVRGASFVPVLLPETDAALDEAARFWSSVLADGDRWAFAIPIDEPRDDARRREVLALARRVRAVRQRTGAERLLLAVTDEPRPVYEDAVDIFVSPSAISRIPPRNRAARARRWTYNGRPPLAGSMVVDAADLDLRTWGWIAWRWDVPLWYVWDALYWHDRHNARRAKLARPGRPLDPSADAVSFDDGTDHGNLDGVLALPGDRARPCRPTLRLKALRRGLYERLLLEAASCTPAARAAADALAKTLVPVALADARGTRATAPKSAAAWSAARTQLLELASACRR
ncbi:MAG: hypothetical protein R3B48_12005 [Kofleriaceae bacterium]